MRWTVAALLCALVGLTGLVAAPSARAQPAEEPAVSPGEPLYEEARQLYRDRRYSDAFDTLVRAIQADPRDPRYYIGAARAANFAEQYDRAVVYYDLYLEHFPEHAEAARRRADRLEAIERERNEANSRRANREAPVERPADQTAALAALQERLRTGPYMSPDGTGAYTMYQTLLRTGYAAPNLYDLREQLTNGILTETQALFWPSEESPVPSGTLALWQSIRSRYEAVAALGRDVLEEPVVQARIAAAEGQVANLNRNTRFAIERFQRAIELDPNLLFAQIGLLLASHEYAVSFGCCAEVDAQAVLGEIQRLLELQAPQHLDILPLLRGMVDADTDDYSTAAQQVIGILVPERRVTPPSGLPGPSGGPSLPPSDAGQTPASPDGSDVDRLPKDEDDVPAERLPVEGLPPAEL